MTLEEARRILGVDPEEDPASRLEEFEEARDRLADLVRHAPNDTIALRYQGGLQDFDRALAAVREEVARQKEKKVEAMMALVPGSVSGRNINSKREGFIDEPVPPAHPVHKITPAPKAPPSPATTEPAPPEAAPVKPSAAAEKDSGGGARVRYLVYAILLMLVGGAGGGWLYFHMEAERRVQREQQAAFLEGLGAKLVEGRRWPEAKQAYQRIEALDPGSEIAAYGRRSIEVGMREEQEQFVGYWSGEALAAFEAGRLDDAREAADKVLGRYPGEKGVLELKERIETARRLQVREKGTERVRSAIESREWEEAGVALDQLRSDLPGDEILRVLEKEIDDAREQQQQEFRRARELTSAARLRDQGKFDSQVLDWMREAIALAPEDEEIQAFYEKVASYSRTLRVPQDVPSLEEALERCRDRDRVVLGEGTFPGGLSIDVAIQLEGAGEGKTILTAKAGESPVLTFGPNAKGATAIGLVFQKEGFDPSDTRYPAVQLRGAEVSFSDCRFESASGHGLEVIEGGVAEAVRCLFKGNGWDGAAAHGKGSRLNVRESTAESNFGHGFEVWDGAGAVLKDSTSKRNSRAGILVDAASEGIEISGNEIFGNREYGIVLAAGASGRVTENSCYGNLRGGMVVRFSAISMVVEGNRMEENSGPGLILEQGLRKDIYTNNVTRGNNSGNLVSDVSFDSDE
ncbi:right-handed parallel beta-helix repeat-containing protein [Haloferula sp. A504]|uniref:right-handed parallel beta-helix repeat-containing protein n=1 Tax=Haloferula sp. A504 TaxID=3373601 RepID=UPI0031C49FCF|nr:right-handed parallel beta-helix repeat-containing protein [Verrucomicrobiaceae bacterium E54]